MLLKTIFSLQVHKCMLEDTSRNEAYHKAIFDNKEAFKGKIVLDVGAGTGILSVFCAQAGAAKVYAVEASDTYKLAIEIAQENNLQDVIQVRKYYSYDFLFKEMIIFAGYSWSRGSPHVT